MANKEVRPVLDETARPSRCCSPDVSAAACAMTEAVALRE
jgi:hypothetical protein